MVCDLLDHSLQNSAEFEQAFKQACPDELAATAILGNHLHDITPAHWWSRAQRLTKSIPGD